MDFWKKQIVSRLQKFQPGQAQEVTQLDEFWLEVEIEERVRTEDKMKSSGMGVRGNSLQWEEVQKFHECQRLLGQFFMVDISGKRVMVTISFSLKVKILARAYEGSEPMHRTAVLCPLSHYLLL